MKKGHTVKLLGRGDKLYQLIGFSIDRSGCKIAILHNICDFNNSFIIAHIEDLIKIGENSD